MRNDESPTPTETKPAGVPLPKLMEAIARQLKIQACYNGSVFTLAPYQLFERHNDLFINALNLSKNWLSDDDRRLGQFKVAGLSGFELLEEGFEPIPTYDGSLPRADDVLLLAI